VEAHAGAGVARVVLDAWAVFALVLNEPAAQEVDDVVSAARTTGHVLPMCVVNWCEVLYGVTRKLPVGVDEVAAAIRGLPIALVDANESLSSRAALLKATHPIGLGDAYAAALAMALDAPLLTGDPDFAALEPDLKVRWLSNG
jgi:PIN domain nuclease of toxin-antitoxin system